MDNNAVFDALKSYLLGGPNWTWIQDFEKRRDGRSAWLALKEHFDGPSNQIRLKAEAYASIRRAEYKGAKNFSYELYRRIHTQAHSDLSRFGDSVPEVKKVKDFLDGITDSTLQPVKYTIAGFSHLMSNFHEAANYIGNIIDLNKKNDFRHVGAIGTGRGRGRGGRIGGRDGNQNKNGGRGRGRGKGRGRGGGRSGRGQPSPGRWISSEEWQSMEESEKESIRTARANYAKRNISALEGEINNEDEQPSSSNNPKRSNSADTSSAGDHMGRGNRNYISKIWSGQRYNGDCNTITISSIRQQTNPIIETKAELDSHADTTVAGSSCRVIEFTEKVCDVFPFSDEYQPMKKVPVAKVATAYDHPLTGETFILVFGQALYLGDQLEHTLICPNQARYNNVIVDDVPRHLCHEKRSTHSIYFPDEDIRLPLKLKGVISHIDIRYPSQQEINNCRWLVVTGDEEWNPYDTSFADNEEGATDAYSQSYYETPPDRNRHATLTEETHIATKIFRCCSSIATTGRKLNVTDKTIADTFGCSPETALRTRMVTTQKGIRSMTDHLCRRYRTKHAALRYNQLGGRHGTFYSDTMFSSIKSISGNTMGQIFVNDIGYTYLTPMRLKSEAPNALLEFIQNVGIPSAIHTDEAKELTKGRWKEICQTHGIKQTQTEPYSPFQNRAEVNIRELKKQTRKLMHRTKTPSRLWDHCASYVAELKCLTAQPLYSLHGRTPFELVTGNTPDISEYIAFSWYQPVWYYDNTSFPEPTRHLGRWIGVAHTIGQAMCFWILPSSGVPIARSTVQPISDTEMRSVITQQAISELDRLIEQKIGTDNTDDTLAFEIGSNELSQALSDADDDGHYSPIEPEAEKPDADDYDEEIYSRFTSTEVLLPKGGYEYIA